MVLPAFIHSANRVLMAFACTVVFFLAYSVPNHFHLFEPRLLSLTAWDAAIPFMPWTVFVYISEYVLLFSAYFMFDDELNRNKYVWTFFGVSLVGILFFVLWPTTYPRMDFPIPAGTPWLTQKTLSALRVIDHPSNCFPSMHVALCYATAFAYLPKTEKRIKFWLYFIWSSLVAASTLPTKQHYIVDVASGIFLALAAHGMFFRKAQYVTLPEYMRRWNLSRRQNMPDNTL